ncbi:hypothetical protein V5799_004513 [Amblyomma americanum]|uniref:Uncharacterized protein n=1 Tax=Amblyomma americanum TaxID=6943 RepID=A0AAQ4D5W5_AMBAM
MTAKGSLFLEVSSVSKVTYVMLFRYLYTLNTPAGYRGVQVADQTLEVIMQDLDQGVMSIFTQEGSASARDATQKSGIDRLYPTATLDEFLFSPCGYSVNGILKGQYLLLSERSLFYNLRITDWSETAHA